MQLTVLLETLNASSIVLFVVQIVAQYTIGKNASSSILMVHYIESRFPNHPQAQHRKPCGAVLMKNVKSSNGKVLLYPKLIYTYKSITESLQELLRNPGFSVKCEAWRKRPTRVDYYYDVYDGEIWKDFQNPDGRSFLSVPNNFAFQINVDWFNPFTHT